MQIQQILKLNKYIVIAVALVVLLIIDAISGYIANKTIKLVLNILTYIFFTLGFLTALKVVVARMKEMFKKK
jgi:hypothetical protein